MFMRKKAIWNVSIGLILKFEIKSAFDYNLTPQARREIKKIIYGHFDYIVGEWNNFFKIV